VLILEDYRYTVRYTAPAPSEVAVLDNLPFEVEEVTFEGGDGLRLAGWFVPPRNGATIILLHGYGGNRTGTVWYAIPLVEAGYGVLMYDERASGESEGTMRSYGWQDVPDVGGALAYLSSRPDVDPDRIGIAGCSIGGQIALRGAAAYPQIRAALADGPSSVTAADDPPPHNWATALSTLSGFVIDRMFEARLGMQAPPPMIETIGLIAPRPILLIAGGTPHPYYGSEAAHVECFYQHAGDNAELWVIPEAYHCDGLAARPQEYVNRMIAFFDAAVD
jgi:pimeloyl-ACP methyl ester carboxylesterase